MAQEYIEVSGAREHNLKNVAIKIPKRKLVVFTGVSGSGKSSLAFDTLYAEGQRRYVESLSSYARQFLGQMEKPKYDHIRGLSPTISIEQKAASNNPRSTVGTITEISDYMRVLWARIGQQHCYQCGRSVGKMSAEEIVDLLEQLPEGTKYELTTRVLDNRKGEHREMLLELRKAGYTRARYNGADIRIDELETLDKKKKHTLDVIIDRLASPTERSRLTDSVETALALGNRTLRIEVPGGEARIYSEHLYCHYCDIGYPELSPQSFSFNSPLGMCPDCNGLGTRPEMDPALVIPDQKLSLNEGALEPWKNVMEKGEGWSFQIFASLREAFGIDLDTPFEKLSKKHRDILLYGSDKPLKVSYETSHGEAAWNTHWEGALHVLYRRFRQTKSEGMRKYYMRYLSEHACSACEGARLRIESRHVKMGGETLDRVSAMTILNTQQFFDTIKLSKVNRKIAEELLKEIGARLGFLLNVGLNYLTLDRLGPTLSGGESQRIRLASQIGSELTGVLYILDEPSIGLHQRDNGRLLATLQHLRDIGNSVLVVEHDEETIAEADFVVDFGPGAGVLGGEIVVSGSPSQVMKSPKSLTGAYLSGRKKIEVPSSRRPGNGKALVVYGATENNLRNIDVSLPLGCFVAISGVSGAGKSSLINRILFPALKRAFFDSRDAIGAHKRITGMEHIDKVIDIDQQPIGRTPRSNPATYTKVFDLIRDLFATTPEAKAFGYQKGRFSFNVKGGRCESCEGDGLRKIEMHFLPDVYVSCEVCHGKRFNDATLRVRFKGLSIHDVLELSIDEALEIFANQQRIVEILQTLADVGLGYVKLGQPSPTLSGGEAQRIKLSRELAKRSTGKTLYILDEPTTGLHFEDIGKLLGVLERLVESGNSVVVIEHNLDVIKCADHVIDLGPEGGDGGGQVVAKGTPEEVAKVKESVTGHYLKKML